MRLYLLVTNYNPLTIYIYKTGFARFTNSRYDNSDVFDLSNIIYAVKLIFNYRGTFD